MSCLSERRGSMNVLVEYFAVALAIFHPLLHKWRKVALPNFFNAMHCVGDCPSPYGLSHLLQSPSGVTVFNKTLLLVMLLV